jgi:hypothetical protein
MSGHEQDTDIRDSTPNSTGPSRAAGGMGVSSERVGHTGPGQYATDGIKDTSRTDAPHDEETSLAAPSDTDDTDDMNDTERPATGRDRLRASDEPRVEGLEPVAGYPSLDPRSERKPFKPSADGKHSGSTG